MIIYLCIKFYDLKIWIQYTNLFKRYQTETIFQIFFNVEKEPQLQKWLVDFSLNPTWPVFYNDKLVYKVWINPIH